jgi:hypothetical protein
MLDYVSRALSGLSLLCAISTIVCFWVVSPGSPVSSLESMIRCLLLGLFVLSPRVPLTEC